MDKIPFATQVNPHRADGRRCRFWEAILKFYLPRIVTVLGQLETLMIMNVNSVFHFWANSLIP